MKEHLTRLRPLLLVMAAFVFLVQCQAEYLETNPISNGNSSTAKHRILTGTAALQKRELLISTLKANGGLEQLSKKINPNGAASRTFKDIETYIDYSEVYEVQQHNGITNYTFRVAMPEASETVFYNLVLKQDSHYSRSVLVKYKMDTQFAADYYNLIQKFDTFTGTISVEVLGIDEGNPCDEEPNIPIPVTGGNGPGASGGLAGGGGSGGGGSGGGGTNPGYTYNQDLVNAQYLSLAVISSQGTTDPNGGGEDGGGENGGDSSDPWFEVSRSPRGYGWRTGVINDPVLEDPSNPCDDEEEVGVLDPEGDPHENNCDELKKMTNDPVIKAKIQNLENNAEDGKEHGWAFSDDAPPVELQTTNNNANLKYGGTYYGNIHEHTDPVTTDAIPMFSISDLFGLLYIANTYQTLPKNYHKFFFTLTVPVGNTNETYAVKIEDYAQFRDSFQLYKATFTKQEIENDAYNLAKAYTKTKGLGGGATNYFKDLFKFTNKKNLKGFTIYKTNDLENWERVNYNPTTNTITTTPCN